ncbi:unnamed protein product [Cyprideis torosa]|uniref:Uncharacterized protein n=1 Tax=Cyprideis torosa TaxID=163714 RepID=A0A7R8ZNV8_9CRUS|nr:unnamed protein product [Cyprideis torosa]CAG0898946.1 unnamed protein product [Cyprideis torosa]
MAKPEGVSRKVQKDRRRRLMERTSQASKRKAGRRQRTKALRNSTLSARSGVQAGNVAKKPRRTKRTTKKRSKKPKAAPAGPKQAQVPHQSGIVPREQETDSLNERREGGDDRVEVEHSHDEAGADQQASPSTHQCVRIGGIQYFAVCGLNRYGRIAAILTPVELLKQNK